MPDDLCESALEYHRHPTPGKIEVTATKPLANQRDLALAYSPGVAAACELIVEDPKEAASMTSRGNLVAVITNGSAVLGLGAIGPLAAKPVMEGKSVLFKKFAGIDVFDIEIDENDPQAFIDTVARLEPSFGGINLEDIKAPECFEIERALRERMNIPVFHDDQHGTAIIVGAAVLNALKIVGKNIARVKLVASGAGAAGLACLDILISLGLTRENVTVVDRLGVVYKGRAEQMDERKAGYAQDTEARTLAEVIPKADIFLGLSAPGVLTGEMVKRMAKKPIIMALANPVPEILPEDVRAVREDAIIATGRSDYPNQVNNVLCFPFIFRGALDVGATTINEEMKIACVRALAKMAQAEIPDVVTAVYRDEPLRFGPEYLIPKPFDPRLMVEVAPAVARAAMDSGVATRPITDFEIYRERLNQFVFRSGLVMKPLFECARNNPRRLVYAEGEESRVLHAVQEVVTEGIALPILIGRPRVISARIEELGLRIQEGRDFEVINILGYPDYERHSARYHEIMQRKGISPRDARKVVRTRQTVIASLMVEDGSADAMVCGVTGRYHRHLRHILNILGLRPGVRQAAAMNVLVLKQGTYFICDTYVTADPSAEQVADMTLLAAEEVFRIGIEPKVALLSHSSFGTSTGSSACKMRDALRIIQERSPDLEVEGEMHADAALCEEIRELAFPNSRLTGEANLLVMPSVDAANISYNLIKVLGDGVTVGPVLLGIRRPAHIMTPSTTVRRILNMSALAVVDAQMQNAESA